MGTEYSEKDVTYEKFMRTKFYGIETPMDLAALMDLMCRHKDMYYMTDFKNCYDQNEVISGFQQIVQAAEEAGCVDVLKRFIIQNHHNQFKHWVDSVYPFENWVYTCYSIPVDKDRLPENLTAYCSQEGIPIITMWYYMPNDTWFSYAQKYNLKIFIHTVNDVEYAKAQLSAGVAGVYTDDIKPPIG